MSSIDTVSANPTELRLDYKDVVAGRLIIVIDGLPTGGQDALSLHAGGPARGFETNERRARSHPSSPLTDEATAVGEAIADLPALFTPLLLAAWRGREALASELVAATIEQGP